MKRTGEPSVFLAEPHPLYRLAFESVLDAPGSGFMLSGAAGAGEDIATEAQRCGADIVLVCIDDIREMLQIRRLVSALRDRAVVVTSAVEDGRLVVETLRAGAAGFVPKAAAGREILQCLHGVRAGKVTVHGDAAALGLVWAAHRMESATDDEVLRRLTAREREVVGLLAEGLATTSIARRLMVSPRTVEGHLTRAYRKLGAHNAVDAVRSILQLRGAS